MKIIRIVIAFILISFVCQAQSLLNTEPMFWFGAYTGMNINNHFSDFDSLTNFPHQKYHQPKFSSNWGYGFNGGISLNFKFSKDFWAGLRFGLSTLNAKLSRPETDSNQLIYDNIKLKNIVSNINFNQELDTKINTIGFEPTVGYRIIYNLYAFLTIKISNVFTARYNYSENLTTTGVAFLDESTTRYSRTGLIVPNTSSWFFSGSLGLGYDWEIGKYTYLRPEIKYYYPLSSITSDVSWKPSNLHIALALELPVYPFKKIQVIKETIFKRDTTTVVDDKINQIAYKLLDTTQKTELQETSDKQIFTTFVHEKWQKSIPVIKDTNNIRDTVTVVLKNLTVEKIVLKETKKKVDENRTNDALYITTTITEKFERQKPEPTAPTKKLLCNLTTVGVSSTGDRTKNPKILVEEFETEETFALLPYVFYKSGSAELSETTMHLIGNSETGKFSEEVLPWNTLQIYNDLLNVIGERMKNNPSAKITIVGCNSNVGAEKNNKTLSQKRADVIKNYLTSVWNIESDRIKTENRNLPAKPASNKIADGLAENQRAEIVSNSLEIIKPIPLKKLRRTSNPPKIEIVPEIIAEAGLKNWNVKIENNGNLVTTLEEKGKAKTITWDVEYQAGMANNSLLKFALTAFDSANNSTICENELPLQILSKKEKVEKQLGDKKIEVFSLIVFDYDKADFTQQHIAILNTIKPRIQENSIVNVNGYADRTGGPEYNRKLALKRCQAVEKYLGKKSNLSLNPVGSDVLLYENDTPQGRFYSRTVKISIETPITK